jgi:hypothetical protein
LLFHFFLLPFKSETNAGGFSTDLGGGTHHSAPQTHLYFQTIFESIPPISRKQERMNRPVPNNVSCVATLEARIRPLFAVDCFIILVVKGIFPLPRPHTRYFLSSLAEKHPFFYRISTLLIAIGVTILAAQTGF